MRFRLQLSDLPLALLLLTITLLSVLPLPALPTPSGLTDKESHFIAYGSAALVGFLFRPRAGWRLLLILVAWGIGIELIQALIPSRLFELLDIVANSLGVALGWGLAQLLNRWLPRRRSAHR